MSESYQTNREDDKSGRRKHRIEAPEPHQQTFALDEIDLLSNSPGLFSQAAAGSDFLSHGPSSLLSRAPSSLLQRQASALAGREDKLQGGYPQLRLRGRNFAQLPGPVANRPLIQAKLTIGPAADAYEQEADRVAEQVVSAPAPPATLAQRAGEEDELQAKPLAATLTPLVQRELAVEELQAKFVQRAGGGFEANAEFENRLDAARGDGAPLPAHTRNFMEQRLGADFSGVRVHTDARSDQLNQAIQAKAFTTRQGTYEPGRRGGQMLIAQELTHVVQQNGGKNRDYVIQRAWGELTQDNKGKWRQWDSLLEGLRWYWNAETNKLYYMVEGEVGKDGDRLRERQGEEYFYEDWIKAGWPGLEGEEKPGSPKQDAAENQAWKQAFQEQYKTGRRRYGLLEGKQREVEKASQAERDRVFTSAYTTTPHGRREEGNPYAPRTYKTVAKGGKHQRSGGKEKEGHYINEVDLAWGKIVADQNYADRDVEKFIDPTSRKEERYSNSEVFYQQWKKAKSELPQAGEGSELAQAKLATLRRAHVAGEGIEPVKVVKKWYKSVNPRYDPDRHDARMSQKDDGFFALLATANCNAAIWLVIDHGKELGIKDIKEIRLMRGESIEIDFEPE